MISFKSKGDFSKATRYLDKLSNMRLSSLDKFGAEGVAALASATPVESGLTANSWYYEIERANGTIRINFCNSNFNKGVPIAIILYYGHGTRNGGWVAGRQYIDPAIQPVFDRMASEVWKEVTSL